MNLMSKADLVAPLMYAIDTSESAALLRYFDKGGRLLIALDPESGDMHELVGPTEIVATTWFVAGSIETTSPPQARAA